MVETAEVTYQKGQLYQLNLSDLETDPNQPRKVVEQLGLDELTASIKEHGVLQPILFRVGAQDQKTARPEPTPAHPEPTPAHPEPVEGQPPQLYVVAGERRFVAAQNAGLTTIPAIFVEGNTAEIALVENLLRQDLTAVEEAEALQRLKDEQKYTDEQLGGVIGKARTTLNEILSLNKLPQEIRDECRGDRTINKSTLITIARKKQERAMMTAYKAYKAKQLKGKTTRQKKDPNDPQALFDMMDKTMTKLRSIDPTPWTEEAQANFQTALANLKIEITNHQLL